MFFRYNSSSLAASIIGLSNSIIILCFAPSILSYTSPNFKIARSFTSTQIHILHSPILPHHKPLSPTSSSSSKELILDLDPVGFFDFKLPAAVYFFAATGPIKKQRLSEKHQDKGEGEAHAQESKEKGPNCKYV
ncbi:hypothetical protein F2Q68_00009656 [Brassica cretica]|uniref:Uncharacterized protein n=1 Tax=Brassica cretica TaxID=69181 RepID=A0A8S9IGQ4_BRACR|nr:hypothetical protein F2Q68_00025001 [Brassica cretica]KAF2596138.1 hypothetical protein F2Q68_00009656 [Brassica cretica]